MAECAFCNERLRGLEPACPRCGNRVAIATRTPPAAAECTPDDDPELGSADVDEAVAATSLRARLRELDAATLLALVAGSLALLLASIPSVSFLTKPLGALGLLAGVVGGVVPAWRRQANVGLPIAVSALSLLVLLFAGSWRRAGAPSPPSHLAVPLNQKGMTAAQPVDSGDWVDARTNAVRLQDLRVQIIKARVGKVELETQGKKASSAERYLILRLQVSFEGVVFRQIPYEPWADLAGMPSRHPPLLIDHANRSYAQKAFAADQKVVGRGERTYLTPGRQVTEVLVFSVPASRVEYLRLQLPAAAFGVKGEFKLQIPWSMVEPS